MSKQSPLAAIDQSCNVRIYNLNIRKQPQQFVRLSGGTVAAQEILTARYDQSARIPRSPWRPPAPDELSVLMTSLRPTDMSRTVVVLRVSDELVQILRQLDLHEINTAYGFFGDGNDLQKLILSYLSDFCTFDGEIFFHRMISHPPGLPTVTKNLQRNIFNGLHVDSWDSPPDSNRSEAANRITINVGKSSRTFLFVNLSVDDMARALQQRQQSSELALTGTELGRKFLEVFPDYPTVGVELAPSEAYIAPTDNIMHDASSETASKISWHITIRARICIASRSNPFIGPMCSS